MKKNNYKRDIIVAFLLASFCVLLCCGQQQKQPEKFLPTGEYVDKEISGFTVKIAKPAVDSAVMQQALAKLAIDMEHILSFYTQEQLNVLQQKPVWMEINPGPKGAAHYHPEKQWLIDNNVNPDKAKCVEIWNVRNYLAWTAQNQPYMILHELSHLYHDLGLPDGYANQHVKDIYEIAEKTGKYDSVRYYNGKDTVMRKAYAMNNAMEYFAELSEAYFGDNDFQPFNRQELKTFDLPGFALMEEIWGKRE